MSPPTDDRHAPGRDSSVAVDGFADFERIGSGVSSTVYRARQVRMDRPVAVKVLHADLRTDRDRRMFERECRAIGLVSRHPHIVTVHSDAYTTDGRPCLVMELYHGNYRDRIDQLGALPLREILGVGVKIGGALQAAHDAGVLHRDIKPHNLFLSEFGEPALGDFGISTLDDERTITAGSGMSVAYAAPEVVDDGTADFLSDVYSLSATLFHLAAGHPPFIAAGMRTVMRRILDDDPPPIGRSDVPASLDELLRRGMDKDPAARPESAEAFARSLRDVQEEIGAEPTPLPMRTDDAVPGRPGAGKVATPAPADVPAAGPDPGRELMADPASDPEATLLRDPGPRTSPSSVPAPSPRETGDGAPPAPSAGHDVVPTGPEMRRRRRLLPGLDRSWIVDAVIAIAVIALLVYAIDGLR